MPDFKSIAKIEPKLLDLEKECKSYALLAKQNKLPLPVCANQMWYCINQGSRYYPGIRHKLMKLVGWDAHKKELATTQAYDAAVDYLYNLLPDCENCLCL